MTTNNQLNATSVIVDDTTTNATMFPVWVTANIGSLPLKVSSTKYSFDPSTAILTIVGGINGLTGTISAPTGIVSSAGANILLFNYITSAVNYFLLTNNSTGNSPSFDATGSDSAVPLILRSKNAYIGIADSTGTIGLPLRFYNAAVSHYTGLKIATSQSTDVTFTLPAVDGAGANALMKTDGSANLGFTAPLTASGLSGITTSSQTIVQQVYSETGAAATGTTTIPLDDTIPQNTEGDQYFSLAITPKNSSNILVIESIWNGTTTAASAILISALFQDSTANALAAWWFASATAGQSPTQLTMRHIMVAGTTSSTTFKIRVGANAAGTTTINGNNGSRFFAGVMASSLRITEYIA